MGWLGVINGNEKKAFVRDTVVAYQYCEIDWRCREVFNC